MRLWYLVAVAIIAVALAPGVVAAQQQAYLYIREPAEWREGNKITLMPGRSITIRGIAGHPSGVLRVLVNGEEAFLRRDTEQPDDFHFEKVVTVTQTTRDIIIVIVPRASEQRTWTFGVEPTTPARGGGGGDTIVTPARQPNPAPTVRRVYNPGSVAVRSLLVPGLGQFQTRRPALGAAFLVGAGGALALGLMSQKVTVECLTRTTDSCPTGQARDETSERTMLVPGIAGFVVLGVISAFEASSAARRANAQASGSGDADGVNLQFAPALMIDRGDATRIRLLQLRF